MKKEQATFLNFKKDAKKYSILHLSTHVSTGDIYNQASIRFYDSEIVYSELYNLDIIPDLVVLSACEKGLGKLYKSEGAMSVALDFQFAGAQNLLFSLWKVNDYTTSVFMKDFYKNNNKFDNYLEAIHQAKLDFLANSDLSNSKKSPYYWSALVYYGAINEQYSYLLYLIIITGILILIFIFYKLKKKKSKFVFLFMPFKKSIHLTII